MECIPMGMLLEPGGNVVGVELIVDAARQKVRRVVVHRFVHPSMRRASARPVSDGLRSCRGLGVDEATATATASVELGPRARLRTCPVCRLPVTRRTVAVDGFEGGTNGDADGDTAERFVRGLRSPTGCAEDVRLGRACTSLGFLTVPPGIPNTSTGSDPISAARVRELVSIETDELLSQHISTHFVGHTGELQPVRSTELHSRIRERMHASDAPGVQWSSAREPRPVAEEAEAGWIKRCSCSRGRSSRLLLLRVWRSVSDVCASTADGSVADEPGVAPAVVPAVTPTVTAADSPGVAIHHDRSTGRAAAAVAVVALSLVCGPTVACRPIACADSLTRSARRAVGMNGHR